MAIAQRRDLRRGGTGKMPSNSTFVFQPQDIDVIEAWLSKGGKND